jgi:iron(III) transport system permease protein
VLPQLALLQAALSRSWSEGLTAHNLTLANFARLIAQPGLREAITNSLMFAAASALLATFVAVGVAILVTRRKVAFSGVLAFIAMVPYVIPGMVLSIGFYATFAAPPVALYGTGLLLVLAFTVRFLPITYAGAAAALASLNSEMEDAGRILGAGRLTVLARITLPLVKRSVIAAAAMVFILASHELSTAVLLAGPSTRVVSLLMLEFADNGQLENLAAMGTALMLITLMLVASSIRLIGRDSMVGRFG